MHTKNLHVIKASAGTGKTFTLAKVYIEQLLWGADGNLRPAHSNYHQHILAITFTNKATAEMKERIIMRLYELSQGTCSAYEGSFLKAHPGTSPEELKKAAKAALEDILFDFTAFNISTIDSFFQTVLRNFVYELDREYDYDLQLDEGYARLQAVQGLMQSIGDGRGSGYLSGWIEDYVTEQVRNKNDWNFFGSKTVTNLADFAKVLGNENFMKYRSEIADYLSDVASGKKSRLLRFQQALAKAKVACEEKINGFHTEVAEFFKSNEVTPDQLKKNSCLLKLKDASDLKTIGNSFDTIVKYAADVDKLQGTFLKKAITDTLLAALPTLQSSLQEYVDLVQKMNVAKAIAANLWQLGLLGKIDDYLEQYRKDNNQILISDTADLIAKVLECDVPFIYERMGVWLNHFMIDEFQDTSRKQYDNFLPLLQNSLSDGHYNLIIGDEKQSIYRFRNSDPNLFQTDLPHDFPADYDDSEGLHINFRSFRHVVGFNNDLFKHILDYYAKNHVSYKKLQRTYAKLHQDYPESPDMEEKRKNANGYVRLQVVYANPTKDSGELPYFLTADGEKMYGKDGVLAILPEYILDQHERLGYPFGKILVLVNRNTEGNEVVKAILEHNRLHPDRLINIVSAESLLLQNSSAVRLIISVLQFLNSSPLTHDSDSDDTDSTVADTNAEAIAMARRLKEQLHYKILHDFGHALGEADADADAGELLTKVFRSNDKLRSSSEAEQVKKFTEQIQCLLPDSQSEQSTLVSVVDKIIKEYLEPIGLNKGAETSFLLAFQGVVLEFSSQRSNGGTIYEFLKYWETKKDKLAISPGQNDDAVEVMTIHKAKGLERSCVIVPFANWEMARLDTLCWVPAAHWLKPDGCKAPFLSVPAAGADSSIVPPLVPIPGEKLAKIPEFGSFTSPMIEDCLIDSLNKSYVAFTRPNQTLHIFASALAKKFSPDNITTINEHLLTTVPNLEGCRVVMSDKTGAEGYVAYYEIGEEEHYVNTDNNDKPDVEQGVMPDYTVIPVSGRLKVKLPDLATKIQDSGTRMHHIVSRVRTAAHVHKALEYAAKRRIVTDDADQYWNLSRAKAFLSRLTTDPQTTQWFAEGNRVYNEHSFFLPSAAEPGKKHQRPDRIVRTPDGRVCVIDYKFGDTPSERQQAGYEKQVRDYCELLSNIWHTPVEGYLLHAKSFTVQKVCGN